MILPLGNGPLGAGEAWSAGGAPTGDVGAAALPLRVVVFSAGSVATAVLPLRVSVLSSGVLSGAAPVTDRGSVAATWVARVEVDGVDVSADVVGAVVVEAEEGAARIADMTLAMPPGASVSPVAWVGRRVPVALAEAAGGGALNAMLLFSGRVDLPALGSRNRTLALRCTDNLQGVVGAMSKADIAAMLPGARFSPVVFDTGATAWQHAGDLLSTLPVALDLSPGGALRVTPWGASPAQALSFNDDKIIDESISVDIAERSALTNQVMIEFGYRFPRIKAEGYVVAFDYLALHQTSFVYWVRDNNNFLQRAQVEAAISASGGSIVSVTWIPLPATAQIIPGTGGAPAGAWLPNPPVDGQYCLGFSAVVSFDYAQQIDETHLIAVEAQSSIAAIGAVRSSMSGALEGVYDDPVAAEQNILLYRRAVTKIPPKNMAPVVVGLTNSVDATLTTDSDRAAADTAMETLIAIASTKIHAGHRRHSVRAAVPCNAALDVDKTVAINAQGIQARGKLRRVTHRLDADTGSAISEIELAVSRAAGVGISSPWDMIAAPAGTSDGTTSTLAAPVVTWNGLFGEDNQLTISFPGVADAERDKAQAVIDSVFLVRVAEDVFEVMTV